MTFFYTLLPCAWQQVVFTEQRYSDARRIILKKYFLRRFSQIKSLGFYSVLADAF
jgi:hypothetical protein